jgi:hypothetical protein
MTALSVLDPKTAARLSEALAAGPAQLLDVLNDLFLALPGVRTVTWLAARPAEKITRRIGTSDPQNFPIGGFDPIDDGAWSRRVYGDKLPIIGNTPAEMAVYIPETDELVRMGYGALICAPIVIDGAARGTVNLLGDAGIFTPALLGEIDALLPLAALIFTFEGVGERERG